MATTTSHNKNNSAVKRIMQEAKELANDTCTDYAASPLEDDIFEWHCTIRGPVGTEFEGGLYHFRILLPSEYPFRPPSLMMLTPNGRFELNTKICISFTSYHEELWQPAWGVRTAIIGLQGFFPLRGKAAVGVGALETPISERKRLAKLSRDWVCPRCNISNVECLPDPLLERSASVSKEQASTSAANASGTADVSDVSLHSTTSTAATPVVAADEVKTEGIEENKEKVGEPVVAEPSASSTASSNAIAPRAPTVQTQDPRRSPRPPVLLDATIAVLLFVVVSMMLKKLSKGGWLGFITS